MFSYSQQNSFKILHFCINSQTYSAERQISLYYEEASKDCRPRFKSALYLMEVDANLTLSSSPKIVGQVEANSCGSDADIQVYVWKFWPDKVLVEWHKYLYSKNDSF